MLGLPPLAAARLPLHRQLLTAGHALTLPSSPGPPRPPATVQLHPAARKKKPSLKTASEEEDATQRQQANALQHQAYQQGGRAAGPCSRAR